MGFMQSYKRLDKLCRDMNGVGVTGYIADMEQVRNGNFYVPVWNADYRKLKYYRHIRNQIAHEIDAVEETMCFPEDAVWIEEFHQRILHQADPLAEYYKAVKLRENMMPKKGKSVQPVQHFSPPIQAKQSKRKAMARVVAGIVILVILAISLILFLK